MRYRTFLRHLALLPAAVWCSVFGAPALAAMADNAMCPVEAVAGSHSWSPDGTRIAFAAADEGIKILATRFGVATRIMGDAFFGLPLWSPDGNRIAILQSDALEDGGPPFATLYMWDTSGIAPPTPLASGISSELRPVWSPDSMRMIAASVEGSLIIVDARTGDKKIIHERRSDSRPRITGEPAWMSADEIIYQIGRGDLYVTNLETGATRRLRGSGTYTTLSPQPGGDLWASTHKGKNSQITLLRGNSIALAINAPVTHFSGPNHRGLIAARFLPRGGLKLIDTGTGIVTALTTHEGDASAAFSPDGGTVAFTRHDTDAEAVYLCTAQVP
jgi:dipeptidyl aminopeptidase/acylaminoacyl peptidase